MQLPSLFHISSGPFGSKDAEFHPYSRYAVNSAHHVTVKGQGDLEEGKEPERDPLAATSREMYTQKRGDGGRMWRRRVERGVFAPRTLKNGECQNEIKNVERGSRREREKWAKVRVDDRLKNEEGDENPV